MAAEVAAQQAYAHTDVPELLDDRLALDPSWRALGISPPAREPSR